METFIRLSLDIHSDLYQKMEPSASFCSEQVEDFVLKKHVRSMKILRKSAFSIMI